MERRLNKIRLTFLFTSLFFSSLSHAALANKNSGAAWGYTGDISPQYWGNLDKNYTLCASGTYQSPIDIVETDSSDKNTIALQYQAAPLNMVNNGHTLQVNFTSNVPETLIADRKEYRLLQIHLHMPSENHLNGQSFPAELHFVHQGQDGKLAVLGIFIKEGKTDNAALADVLKNLPKEKGKVYHVKDQKIDVNNLIPEAKSFYSFYGSLTTPPCTEGIQWLVMANPISASAAQLQHLKKVIAVENARPIQLVNNRKIVKVELDGDVKQPWYKNILNFDHK